MATRTPALLIRRLLLGAVMLAVMAVVLWLFAMRWTPSRSSYPLQGVDVSALQGDIDWPSARAAGTDFAYIKATQGTDVRDERFAANWQAARDAGLRRGAYHVYSLCRLASDQATNFIATVPRDDNALPAALDLDFDANCGARPDRKLLLSEVALFIQMVEAHTGKAMIIYMTQEFEDAYQISPAVNRSLWLRGMFFTPNYGSHPWVIWQANNQHRVDGISGPVGWNVLQP